jgi:hypothetical protein
MIGMEIPHLKTSVPSVATNLFHDTHSDIRNRLPGAPFQHSPGQSRSPGGSQNLDRGQRYQLDDRRQLVACRRACQRRGCRFRRHRCQPRHPLQRHRPFLELAYLHSRAKQPGDDHHHQRRPAHPCPHRRDRHLDHPEYRRGQSSIHRHRRRHLCPRRFPFRCGEWHDANSQHRRRGLL